MTEGHHHLDGDPQSRDDIAFEQALCSLPPDVAQGNHVFQYDSHGSSATLIAFAFHDTDDRWQSP